MRYKSADLLVKLSSCISRLSIFLANLNCLKGSTIVAKSQLLRKRKEFSRILHA